MRILITTGIFRPEPGGPATYTVELARRLKTTGHAVTVITYSDKPSFDFDKEYPFRLIRVVRQKSKLLNYYAYFKAVLAEAKKVDIIYSLDWFSAGVPVMLASFFAKKKYIVRVGGGYIWEKYLAQGNPPLTLKAFYEKKLYKKYRVMYYLIKLVLRRAERVVFNSVEQRGLYHTYYGLSPAKTLTIFNPVPESRLGPLMKSYKKKQHETDKEIVFAGRFIKMKNVDSAIKAFARLHDQSFRLLLIGQGPEEFELRKLVAALGIADRVEFLPPLSMVDLYRRIANCYYVILPSWTDVSPNQIYECMSLGIPFLLTKENYLSINSHHFLKIDPASVVDIAEKMNRLLDKDEYEAFTESLTHLSFSYSWNEAVVDHIRLMQQVV